MQKERTGKFEDGSKELPNLEKTQKTTLENWVTAEQKYKYQQAERKVM